MSDNGKHAGAELLNDVMEFMARFVAYPSDHALVAHVLWIAHTHLMDAWESTPRIAFLSPEPASGKSRALDVSEPLVPNPVEAVNVTAAYLFRKVGEASPTVLYDEIDTVFGPKAKENEDIRGLLNAGHRRGAVAGRCVVRGANVVTEELPAYCAVAFAGLGGLPDTILSRCVVIRMRRRTTNERIDPWRRREHAPAGHLLRAQLAGWAKQIGRTVTTPWPTMPDGVTDRDADVWEALLAVADAAGGHWPSTARAAAVALVTQAKQSTPSLGILLLANVRDVFGDADALWTESLLEGLHKMDEAPWGNMPGRGSEGGKPLSARGLASRLGKYDVRSADVRVGDDVRKGYRKADLWDVWNRYLSLPPLESATSATGATDRTAHDPGCGGCSACSGSTGEPRRATLFADED
jgi:hypothetical protein